jgi:hypothetical protein
MSVRSVRSLFRATRAGDRRSPRPVRVVPLLLPVFLLACTMLWFAPKPANAQAPEPAPKTAASGQVAELFDMLDDINKLNILNPLKLTPDQLDQLIAITTATTADYERKLTALKAESIAKLEPEIRATKRRAVAGGEITQAFVKQVTKRSEDFANKHTQLDTQTWVALVAKIRQVLTDTQYQAAVKEIKDEAPQEGFGKNGADPKWFNVYVLQVFIQYPRIVPLLKEMKAATAGAGAQNGAANAGAGTPSTAIGSK